MATFRVLLSITLSSQVIGTEPAKMYTTSHDQAAHWIMLEPILLIVSFESLNLACVRIS
jgi:hypothetical protein